MRCEVRLPDFQFMGNKGPVERRLLLDHTDNGGSAAGQQKQQAGGEDQAVCNAMLHGAPHYFLDLDSALAASSSARD